MRNTIGWMFFIGIILFSCQSEPLNSWKPKSLLEYGIPVTILVPEPDSVKVEKDDLGPIQDITVEGKGDYYLQIYVSEAETSDIISAKTDQLDLVREQQYFSGIIVEDEAGFIFENKIDTLKNYGFRYVLLKGNKEIIFQNHLSRLFTLEQVEKMYNSIKEQQVNGNN